MNEKPTIALFVEDIFQEIYTRKPADGAAPAGEQDPIGWETANESEWNGNWDDDWGGQWYDNSPGGPGWTRDWYNDWQQGDWRSDWQWDWNNNSNEFGPRIGNARAPAQNFNAKSRLEGLISRREPFGALIYDPRSKRAFNVNSAGHGLFLLLQRRASFEELAREGYERESVVQFCQFLRDHAVEIGYLDA